MFAEEKNNGEVKGGKYLEKQNLFLQRRRKENATIVGQTTEQGKIGLLSQWTMER